MIPAKSAITERAMRLIIPKFVPGRREFIPVRRSTVNYDSKAAGPADKPANAALLQENSRYNQSANQSTNTQSIRHSPLRYNLVIVTSEYVGTPLA